MRTKLAHTCSAAGLVIRALAIARNYNYADHWATRQNHWISATVHEHMRDAMGDLNRI